MKTMKAAAVMTMLLAGCASQPPDPADVAAREFRHENARIEAMEKFEERKHRCTAQGGSMQVRRQTSGRFAPTALELRAATCGPRADAGPWR